MAPQPKLTDEMIEQICAAKRADPELTNQALAAQFNLNRHTIASALLRLNTPALAGATGITPLPFELLHESPLNYRKVFDAEKLAELAESIAVRGVLQNLVVRPHKSITGYYEIVAGARRYRAISLLVAADRWNNAALNCRIIETDDAGLIATGILENLQREDPTPLEEADAMLALQASDPNLWTPKVIAQAIGKTPRYVYQRLALANKLSTAAKQALTAGKLTIEAARMLSAQEPAVQDDILQYMDETGINIISAADVRYEVQQYYIPVSRAIFPVDPNEVSIWTNDDDEAFFEIPSEFWTRQLAAVEAKRADLATRWAWALASVPKARMGKRFIEDQAAPRKQQGALIIVSEWGAVDIHLHQVEAIPDDVEVENDDDPTETAAPITLTHPVPEIPTKEPQSPITKSHLYHAHHRKTEALRAAVAADPLLAIRCACFAYLCGGNQVVRLHKNEHGLLREDRVAVTTGHEAIISKLLGKTKPPKYTNDTKAELAVWKHIGSLEVDDLHTLHAALVAESVVTYAGYDCIAGDNPIAVAIAVDAGLHGHEEQHGLTVTAEDLNGVRKATLLAIADDAGTPAVNDEMKPGEIAAAIATKSPHYVLPTLRFATSPEIEKALTFK